MADSLTFPFRTRSGRLLTEADVERLAAEAERGIDISQWKPRLVGRPSLGVEGASPRVQFRLDAVLYRKVRDKAAKEHRSVSAVGRELFEKYAGA